MTVAHPRVAPPRFDYPDGTLLWIPSAFEMEHVPRRGAIFFRTVGRLAVPFRTAQAMFEADVGSEQAAVLRNLLDVVASKVPAD